MKRHLLFCITIIGTLILSNCKKDAPVANFTTDKTTVLVNSSVTFKNSSIDATSYSWTFGDGNSSAEMNPVHTYTTSGQFSVTLTATGKGGANTKSTTVTILPSAAGQWTTLMSFNTGDNLHGSIFIYQNDNNILSGAAVLEDGEGDLLLSTSNVTSSSVLIEFNMQGTSTTYKCTFNGTLSPSCNSMNGTFSIQGTTLTGTWTANKISSKKAAIVTSDIVKKAPESSKLLKLIK